jgi:lipopolysaccharide/colanic/teichoic acid biosynthesis glycosyltransferase
MKRLLDVVIAALALGILLPVLLGIAVAIWLETRGPVLFKQVRIGKNLRPFVLIKFRSMVVDHNGPPITAADDARTTRVGRFLRATKLDELPQLLNVLRGDMSLVGPRPELPVYVAMYEDSFRRITVIRPGITGRASLEYADEASYLAGAVDAEQEYAEVLLPRKLAIEEAYVRNRSLWTDLAILAKTVTMFFRWNLANGQGASTPHRPSD